MPFTALYTSDGFREAIRAAFGSAQEVMSEDASRRRGRPPRDSERALTKPAIVQSAMKLLHEGGVAQLTIRRVAKLLGVKSASLYWHVSNKEELLQLVADEICSRIPVPDASLPWQHRVVELAWAYRRRLGSVLDAAEILLRTAPQTPARWQLIETVLSMLRSAGFSDAESVMMGSMLNDFVISFVLNEQHLAEQRRAVGKDEREANPDDDSDLLADRPKSLEDADQHLRLDAPDARFEFELDTLVRGMEAKLHALRSSRLQRPH